MPKYISDFVQMDRQAPDVLCHPMLKTVSNITFKNFFVAQGLVLFNNSPSDQVLHMLSNIF